MPEEAGPNRPVVLVVDDDRDVLDTTAHMLSVRGFTVLTAASGADALEVCRRRRGAIDALVADRSLPGETGHVAGPITAQCPGIKVVYATGIPRHIALTAGLVQPDSPYLPKPVDPDVLAGLRRTPLTRFAPDR
jgi:CheY-like chemotaxis protein